MRGPSRNSSKACKFTFAGFVAIVLLALCPLILVAQMPNGTILGVVKDSSVEVVPGNNVTIRILETDQTRTAATETNGECRIPALAVGQDEIKAKHSDLSTKKNRIKTGVIRTSGN